MATAKLAAGRDKDRKALVNLVRQGIIKTNLLEKRAQTLSDNQLLDGSTVADLISRPGCWNKIATKPNPIHKTDHKKPGDSSNPGNLG